MEEGQNMETKPIIYIVATQCQPETEVKFNRWYNEVHIPLLFKFQGLKEVTRYRLMKELEPSPRYLAIYQFEEQQDYEAFENSPQLAAATEKLKESWKDGGFEIEWRAEYATIKTWQR